MRRALPIAFAMFLVGAISFAISRLDHAPPSTTVEAPPPSTTAPPASVVDPVLVQIDGRIDAYRQRAEARTDDWLDWEFVALFSIDRARHTGSYNDWAQADAAMDSAFRAAPPGGGPHLTRATINSAMHRIDRVEPDLDAAARSLMLSSADALAILSLRADARFYSGRYAEARELYEQQLAATHRSPESLVAMAQLAWRTGHFDDAARMLDEAAAHRSIAGDSGIPTRAWVLSARAMMERDRGQLDAALTAIRSARALTPNDPAFEQIAAEIHEARGEDDEALHAFRAVAALLSSPQSLDGAARILRSRGDAIAAGELVTAARQSYDGQIALFPEAAYGHAIDHWLRLEPDDVDRMIEIAEGNVEARPYGETQVKLAMAYVLAGRVPDARRVLDEVLATEWQTFELRGVNAITLEREGSDSGAERAAAEAIAPGAMDRLAWLAQ